MLLRRLLQDPSQVMFVALAGVCLSGAALLGAVAWRSEQQLEEVGSLAEHATLLQSANGLLQTLLAEQASTGGAPDRARMEQLRRLLDRIRAQQHTLHEDSRGRLAGLEKLLDASAGPAPELDSAAALFQQIVLDELEVRNQRLAALRSQARIELQAAITLFVALGGLGLVGSWLVSRRVLRPLTDLRRTFRKLERGDFSPVSAQGVHPLLLPLFDNYNQLVLRLAELENEHRSRAASLEGEVRTATETLLDQQRSLARAERLAALGEMTAGLAHELRNPLAGVQMSLANLRGDLSDPDLVERLDLSISELERMTRLLNQQLSSVRHVPEPPRRVDLHTLVEDLLGLLRYQVPSEIRLEAEVDPDTRCRLPRDRLRQALLNLVLNSVQALAGKPGTIGVRVEHRGDRLVTEVRDDGPGLPPDLVKGGGQPFLSRRLGGTGLGLAMVRRLALDLGGELSLDNPEGGGARVRLILPCSHA